MCLNHSEIIPNPTPSRWKIFLLGNPFLVPKRLGTATLRQYFSQLCELFTHLFISTYVALSMFQKPSKCFININSFNSYKNIEGEALCVQSCLTLCEPMDHRLQLASYSLSMEFSRREYWSGLPFLLQDLPDPGIEHASLASPALAGGFFTNQHKLGSPRDSSPSFETGTPEAQRSSELCPQSLTGRTDSSQNGLSSQSVPSCLNRIYMN